MEDKVKQFLIEIRDASRKCGEDPSLLMEKYDIIFAGNEFNIVYSSEVCHSLQKTYGVEISNETLTAILPKLCVELGIKAIPMSTVKPGNNPKIDCYRLTLWE